MFISLIIEKIITSNGSFFYPKKCTQCQYTLKEDEEEPCYWNKIKENLTPECPKCNGLLHPDIRFSQENIEDNVNIITKYKNNIN